MHTCAPAQRGRAGSNEWVLSRNEAGPRRCRTQPPVQTWIDVEGSHICAEHGPDVRAKAAQYERGKIPWARTRVLELGHRPFSIESSHICAGAWVLDASIKPDDARRAIRGPGGVVLLLFSQSNFWLFLHVRNSFIFHCLSVTHCDLIFLCFITIAPVFISHFECLAGALA